MWKRDIIETNRGKFEVFVSGSGNPLCVTHLYCSYDERGNTFANPFTTDYKVFLINHRGCGNSVKADSENQYSMDESVKDLEAIRFALGYDKWGFAGHSTGGMLALKYAILAPSSLTKIIAGGTSASKEYSSDPKCIYSRRNPNFTRIMEIMNQLNDPLTPAEIRKQLGYEWDLMSFYSEEKLKEALKIPNSGKTVGVRLNHFIEKEIPTYDIRDELVNITIPSYIYASEHDVECPYKYGVEIANLNPNAKLTTFQHSNHHPFVEEADKFKKFVKSTCVQ
ncbi:MULTISPECIES: alpha/beta fold hydrolase [Heyndrickxia]|jgi:pimeloyl-ACP methyl ester carboxylesterase|uniref:alpha/beta fold hydrolase n=1 Tax=Heyndrickxia TaxID=2837504 RepID=UPI0015D3CB86|nr:alpha/beta fold hydrolase [Heyndrickxia oleronia]NYV64144.1 alpha/beta fold hydrolase [Bacillus sp. Gen3]MCI1592870.1 alpha/beta hydrolase [Heyndrickxia oleronia]MCI1614518.1 alpha/beta hydrolase [Heyndrickxia oleronia]MCI1743351.1 alpha/beta hydrolase [Heyndrickxia oleronia]MCI1762374.1 alpha/beta hydrolase [Heyndrickxia oleronia]